MSLHHVLACRQPDADHLMQTVLRCFLLQDMDSVDMPERL